MFNHEAIKSKLELFVDNELNEPERKLVEEHLKECPACQHEVEVIMQLHRLVEENVPQPRTDFVKKLSNQVWLKLRKREQTQGKTRLFWLPRLVPIFAGAVTLILVGIISIKFFTTTSRIEKKEISPPPSVVDMLPDKTEAPKTVPTQPKELSSGKTESKRGRAELRKKQIVTVPTPKAGGSYVEAEIIKEHSDLDSAKKESGVIQESSEISTKSATPTAQAFPVESSRRLQPVELVQPEYPESVKQKNLSGKVIVEALVDTNGLIVNARVLKSSGYEILDSAALKSALKSRFEPACQSGKKVRVWVKIPFQFPPTKN
ncbi:MAG: TonB family protein [candidate division WOR-3 bacterium]